MNTPWENPVKKRLRDGLPVVAATITVANPDVAAHAATLGFDFLWVEMEHSPITLETLRNIVLATRGLPLSARRPARFGRGTRAHHLARRRSRLSGFRRREHHGNHHY